MTYRVLAHANSTGGWSVTFPDTFTVMARDKSHARKLARLWSQVNKRLIIGITWTTDATVEDENWSDAAI